MRGGIAISNSRLIRFDARSVIFRVKNYRVKCSGSHTTMTLATSEFIRRFLIHVLPRGQHRIRHYGFFGNGNRAANIAQIRHLLGAKTQTGNTPITTASMIPINHLVSSHCIVHVAEDNWSSSTQSRQPSTPERRQKHKGLPHDACTAHHERHPRPLAISPANQSACFDQAISVAKHGDADKIP